MASTKIVNFIDGSFMPPIDGEYMDMVEPATGKVYGQLANSNDKDVEIAVAAAKVAFPIWSSMSASERSTLMLEIANGIEQRLEAFAEAESKDQGKPVTLARTVDIPRAIYNFRYFAGLILHHEDISTQIEGACSYTMQQPIGIAGLISPWNLPLYLLSWKIAPAIAVGNVCIAKPSEITSLTAHLLCEVISQCKIPKGVINIVYGQGHRVGNALTQHPDIPLISFTGGTATGKVIMQAAALHYKKISLELGGKNPNIIFKDCDLEVAVQNSVRSSFANQGEICLCGSRIFVEKEVEEAFVEQFVAATSKAVVPGDPSLSATSMGALVSKEHYDKVMSYIALAKELGGNIIFGGDRPSDLPERCKDGYFIAPTIITGLPPDSRVQQEEIFGPVVTIWPFTSEKQVVELANCNRYGLSASVWTRDIQRAHRIATHLHAGTVWINTWMKRDLRVPFGGWKHSGIGREGGKYSIDFYAEQKTVCFATDLTLQ